MINWFDKVMLVALCIMIMFNAYEWWIAQKCVSSLQFLIKSID